MIGIFHFPPITLRESSTGLLNFFPFKSTSGIVSPLLTFYLVYKKIVHTIINILYNLNLKKYDLLQREVNERDYNCSGIWIAPYLLAWPRQ